MAGFDWLRYLIEHDMIRRGNQSDNDKFVVVNAHGYDNGNPTRYRWTG